MYTSSEIKKKLGKMFDKQQSSVLSEVIIVAYSDLVKTSDFNELKGIVKELAEAQKRTEKKVEELAEAQKRTEASLNRLIGRADVVEERLEGISNSVGYSLEEMSYKALPSLLEQEGIEVLGRVIRRYYKIEDGFRQINIFAKAEKEGKPLLIIGEVKVRPPKVEINKFLKTSERIKKEEGNPDTYLLFVANDYHPNTEQYLKEKGIRYFWLYELEQQ